MKLYIIQAWARVSFAHPVLAHEPRELVTDFPFAKLSFRSDPKSDPFLARTASTVTRWPIAKSVRAMLWRRKKFGGPASITQDSGWP